MCLFSGGVTVYYVFQIGQSLSGGQLYKYELAPDEERPSDTAATVLYIHDDRPPVKTDIRQCLGNLTQQQD